MYLSVSFCLFIWLYMINLPLYIILVSLLCVSFLIPAWVFWYVLFCSPRLIYSSMASPPIKAFHLLYFSVLFFVLCVGVFTIHKSCWSATFSSQYLLLFSVLSLLCHSFSLHTFHCLSFLRLMLTFLHSPSQSSLKSRFYLLLKVSSLA